MMPLGSRQHDQRGAGQCTGQPKAAAPAPTEALVSTRSDWTDLREAGGHGAPATAEDLGVPSTGIQLGVQVSNQLSNQLSLGGGFAAHCTTAVLLTAITILQDNL